VKVNPALFSCLVPEEWGSRKFAKVDALLSSVGPNRHRGEATREMKYRKSKAAATSLVLVKTANASI
jgi:hypothetical protein